MANTRVGTVNQTVTTAGGTGVVYLLKTHLKAHGWTVLGSGDGLSAFSAPGDVITSANSGANGLDNNRAWVTLGDPGNNRSFTFWRGTTNAVWRITTTESCSLTGGNSTTPLTTPLTDGIISGAGSLATPTFSTAFQIAATWRVHVVSDTVAVPGSNVYPFYYLVSTAGATASMTTFLFDGLISGTYSSDDTAPWVLIQFQTTAFSGTSLGAGGGSSIFRGWLPGNTTLQNLQLAGSGIQLNGFGATTVNGSYGVDPISGLDWMVPLTATHISSNGIKGVMAGVKSGLTIRLTGNTLNLATDPYIYWCGAVGNACLCLPWIDGVAPSL
jgi:hypothetical protein